MVDSHALVGSCAQVGARVHLSAAVQVGGVLEPAGARPVVIEDDAFVGGGCGLYDGVVIGAGAVLGAGVILTGQSRLIDLTNERETARHTGGPARRAAGCGRGARQSPRGWFVGGRRVACRCPSRSSSSSATASTSARVALEDALR